MGIMTVQIFTSDSGKSLKHIEQETSERDRCAESQKEPYVHNYERDEKRVGWGGALAFRGACMGAEFDRGGRERERWC